MKKQNNGKLRIIPLGGLEQIGMNITAFEYEDSIVVVDCGLAFPEDDMLGIDLVIPDVTYLKDNASKVKGFVITHGHEDHIGALPYVLKEINLPIYTTKLTMGIIENKLKEHNLLRTTKRKVVRHGQSINLGKFRIEFIKTNHSIQDASALAIYSPAGVVIHTGDFKVDYTPVFGDAIDLQRFAEIGKKGVLALMSDSTNAERRGFTQSEKTVGITFDHIFAEHQNTRLIIATFACRPCTADHQLCLQIRKKSSCGRAQHGEYHCDSVRIGIFGCAGKHIDRDRSDEELSAGENGSYHNRKSGRVYGGSVENGGGRAQKSDDTAKRYDYLQF